MDAAKSAPQTAAPDSIGELVSLTGPGMDRVNALILERAGSHVEMVPEVAHHLIEAGGKRLRPMLTIASALLSGGPDGSEVNYAASVEFMHTATLLHDDVVDESEQRRGKPAARMVWGNQASVLVGDFLLGQAFMMMVEAGNLDALGVLSRAAAIIAEGEVLQLAKAGDLDASEDDYFAVIEAKTAALFAAATEVGAIAGGTDEAGRKALRDYGHALGIAFQLIDDVLDFGGASGVLGKNVGDDLREGKMTLPVILLLQRGGAEARTLIEKTLGKADTGDDQVAEVVRAMKAHGVLETVMERAHDEAARARKALDVLPEGEIRTLIADIADFCVSRAY